MPFEGLCPAYAPQSYSDAKQLGLAIVTSKLAVSTHQLLTSLPSHLLHFRVQTL